MNQASKRDHKTIEERFFPEIAKLARTVDKTAPTTWLSEYRQEQLAKLEVAQFPTKKVEHFKYNRLAMLAETAFSLPSPESRPPSTIDKQPIAGLTDSKTAECIVFVDGQLDTALTQVGQHRVTDFASCNAKQQQKILAQLSAQDIHHNPFAQLSASLVNAGVLIEIDEKSADAVLEIIHVTSVTAKDTLFTHHVIVDVADNSHATLVSRYLHADNASQHINLSMQQTLACIGEHSQLTHYCLQLENAHMWHFGSSTYNLQSHAVLKAFYGSTGSHLKKADITVNHLGQHTHAYVDGLYAATDDEQIDYHTTINHLLPNGETDEVFRGIVNGRAEATFNGRIHIFEDAQKTRAELSNKNLVLSDEALLHTKPELEIYADDVVCAHGATVSRMNDQSLSYMRARAIDKEEAERMLSCGFFNEVLDGLEHEAIADYLRPILFSRI